MNEPIFLEDLAAMSEQEVKTHISNEYVGKASGFDYGSPSDDEKHALLKSLENFDILVAYESVGSWGCDSSSWFLIRDKVTGKLFESHGGHCSCFGFEGQWEPEETTPEYLKSDKFYLPTGGYDENENGNKAKVAEFLASL